MIALPQIIRKKTHAVKISTLTIGGGSPIAVQAMTNTDTADAEATAEQIMMLAKAGSEMVRITVNNDAAASAVPRIREILSNNNIAVPLVGCFHYNGHSLLTRFPECARSLDKYRINPGNVGFGHKRDKQFEIMIECALKYDKPIRIGVNWGSMDQDLLALLMDENTQLQDPLSSDHIMREAIVKAALLNAAKAEKIGLSADKIVLSAKVSRVQDLIAVYRELSIRSDYALHLGLTEAGMGSKGIVATTAALSILLQEGIGDTIRASLTPAPGGSRTKEVNICQEILQAIGLRNFAPQVSACPGCGRTTSNYFQKLADDIQRFIENSMPQWKIDYPGVEKLNIAIMGCIVNGPGESKHADVGISLPGTGESLVAPVFIDGKKTQTLRGDNITAKFKEILLQYIHNRFSGSL